MMPIMVGTNSATKDMSQFAPMYPESQLAHVPSPVRPVKEKIDKTMKVDLGRLDFAKLNPRGLLLPSKALNIYP